MKTAQAAATDEASDTIEFHGLIWEKTKKATPEYKANSLEIGDFRIYQYPSDLDSPCAGKWLWVVYFTKIQREFNFTNLKAEASHIVDTREEALVGCITARGIWLDEIKALMATLGIGDYATGFKDVQADIAKKIQEVLS